VEQPAMICPKCSRSNVPDAAFCTQCGSPLTPDDRALSTRGTWAFSSHVKPGWRTYDDIPVSPLARKLTLVLVGAALVVGLIFVARIGGSPSSVLTPIYNVGDGTCVHTPSPHATHNTHSWTCVHGHWIAQP
jgi:hypothetical protein